MNTSSIIKKYSDRDLFNQQAKYLFRIKDLINKRNVPIDEIGNCFNYSVHLNSRSTIGIDYLNEHGLIQTGKTLVEIQKEGRGFINKIIEPTNLKHNLPLVQKFDNVNDDKSYLTYFQFIRNKIEEEYTWRLTSRCILDKCHFISITFDLLDIERNSSQTESILKKDEDIERYFSILQTLTKREKEILSLIGKGLSSKDIADLLFISIYTVNEHRKNITRKLSIKNNSQLYKMALLMERV